MGTHVGVCGVTCAFIGVTKVAKHDTRNVQAAVTAAARMAYDCKLCSETLTP